MHQATAHRWGDPDQSGAAVEIVRLDLLPDDRSAGNRHRLAPSGLALFLALQIPPGVPTDSRGAAVFLVIGLAFIVRLHTVLLA